MVPKPEIQGVSVVCQLTTAVIELMLTFVDVAPPEDHAPRPLP